jgi:hypothetical protein
MNSANRLGLVVGLGFVLVALTGGTATASTQYADFRYAQLQNSPAPAFSTPQGQRADGLRLEAIADVYRRLDNRPAASFYTPQALRADGMRWQAMARAYDGRDTEVGATSTGFDWRDAGIGAVGGLGAVIGGAALVLVARRIRRTRLAT